MREILLFAAGRAIEFLEHLDERATGATADRAALLEALDRPLPDRSEPIETVLREMARGVEPGLVASAGPRYFGFVIGGATPASLAAADWLTSAWDQNAQVYDSAPAAAVVEEIVGRWIVDLLCLPSGSSVGFVTGGQMANFTALSAARNAVLSRHGWNVDEEGLNGAPDLRVLLSEQAHATVTSALRMMGLGRRQTCPLPADDQGRMCLDALEAELAARSGPTIVSVQAGNVNSGAFEPIGAIVDRARPSGAWIHVDGAFGLWAAASPAHRHLVDRVGEADSWAVDAHKWLNVPYDSGIVVVRHPLHHQSLKTARCAYAGVESDDRRDGSAFVPENSRRARGFVLYAALRTLGRSGVADLVAGCCACAREFARRLAHLPDATVLNEVVLNQVLARFDPPGVGDREAFHHRLAAAVQREGTCWCGPTRWRDATALRFSFSNWQPTEGDVRRSVDSIEAVYRALVES